MKNFEHVEVNLISERGARGAKKSSYGTRRARERLDFAVDSWPIKLCRKIVKSQIVDFVPSYEESGEKSNNL